MDFLTLNFGQILHLLDNELKNIIRNFKKQKTQIISAQYGILFNQTCLNEELYPAYSNIYIYIHIKCIIVITMILLHIVSIVGHVRHYMIHTIYKQL